MALKPRQLQLIDALLANPMETDIKLAEELGINRNTVREWKKKPEFQEEYRARLAEKWKDAELMAMEVMQTLARNGDFKASKYILDSQGYAPTTKIEADISNKVIINIGEDDEDEQVSE